MKVVEIYYDKVFEKQFENLPLKIQEKATKAEELFRKNPFHPSLRLHKLKGRLAGAWSISIDSSYRIIFSPRERGEFLFFNIGAHSIYDN